MNRFLAFVPIAFALLLSALFVTSQAGAAALSIETVSSKPRWVSGNDALISVTVPAGTNPAKVAIRRNGTVVTRSFKADPDNPRKLTGLVTGLRSGHNTISAWAANLAGASRHFLYNNPITGPVFSGPHQAPFYCTTEKFGAGAPLDADCSIPTTVSYSYRSTDGSFKPLADPSSRPADLARTTIRTGETVDYVVRVEQGTINRAVYRWAVLASGGTTGKGWNGRFFYNFGGGCSTGQRGRRLLDRWQPDQRCRPDRRLEHLRDHLRAAQPADQPGRCTAQLDNRQVPAEAGQSGRLRFAQPDPAQSSQRDLPERGL